MTLPTRQQPNLRFLDQRSTVSCVFNFILETTHTHEELERSWEIIAHNIEIQDHREALQRQAQNRPP